MRTLLLPRYRAAAGIPTTSMVFDFNGALGVTDAGAGKVSVWADQSGNGRDLLQGTDANRPTTGVATINGVNAIRFTRATAQVLSTGALAAYGPVRTVYVVGRSQGGTMTNNSVYYNVADSNQVQYLDEAGETASGAQSGTYAYDGTIRGLTGFLPSRVQCFTTRLDGNVASSSTFRRNGVATGAAFTGSTAANNTITTFRLGANSGSNCAGWDIVRVIGYSVKHSDAEAAAVEAALNALYAFAPTSGTFSGLLLPDDWFDFSDTAAINHTANAVNSVTNKGLNGGTGTQSGTARPTTNTNTVNGLNVLTFDGTDDWLDVGTTIENRGNCVCAVIKPDVDGSARAIWGPDNNAGFLLRYDTTGKTVIDKSNIINVSTATNAMTDDTAVVVGASFANNNAWWHRRAKASNGGGTSTTFMSGGTTSQLGRDRASSVIYKGDFCALFYFRGWMSETEFAAYESVLAAPWGL